LHIFYNIPVHSRPIPLVIQLIMTARGSSDILSVDMLIPASRSRKTAMFAIEKQQLDGLLVTSALNSSCTISIKVAGRFDRNVFDTSVLLVTGRNVNV
jgi:hypothetical protein